MNVFAKFDEIPSMILQDIKETKRYGHTDGRSFVRSHNVKTVYPPTNKVCGGYNYDGLESPMLHTKFVQICPPVREKNIFEGFLPYMGVAAILVM